MPGPSALLNLGHFTLNGVLVDTQKLGKDLLGKILSWLDLQAVGGLW